MQIVLIEDSEELRWLISYILRDEGHAVIEVGDRFHDVLARPFWDGVDGAVVDLSLADDFSGVSILRWLAEQYPDIKRVAFTVYLPGEGDYDEAAKYAPVVSKMDLGRRLCEAFQ